MTAKKHLYKTEYLHPGDPVMPMQDGTLYITGSPALAKELMLRGYPVAAHSFPGGSPCSDFDGIRYIIEDIEELNDEDLERIYRRLRGIPWDICETDRLLIRETTVEDVDTLVELYSDPSTTEFMEDLFPLDEEKEYTQNYIDNVYGFYEIGIWSVIRKEDNALIGRIGIEYTDEEGTVEMGFMLGAACRGLGYAYEAGLAVIKYAGTHPDIKKIRARVHKKNKASMALCGRMGFVLTDSGNDPDMMTWIYPINE